MTTEDIALPELTRSRQDDIERTLFAEITATESTARNGATRRRRRGWAYAAAAAAVLVVAGFVGPALGSGAGAGSIADGAASQESMARPAAEGTEMSGGLQDLGDAGAAAAPVDERAVIARAEARLEADDPADAADEIGTRAQASGGYVESLTVSDAATDDAAATGDARITVRVPATGLTDFLRDLDDLGAVRATDISRDDVTAETTDLRARIASLETSVERLRGLIADAASTADVLAAEDALAQRQADLDALRAREKTFADDVALSSATITISRHGQAVTDEPDGFGDGFATGWNALLVTLNGVVIGLGFLLPWLAVAAVVILIVRVARGARRRRRTDATADDA